MQALGNLNCSFWPAHVSPVSAYSSARKVDEAHRAPAVSFGPRLCENPTDAMIPRLKSRGE